MPPVSFWPLASAGFRTVTWRITRRPWRWRSTVWRSTSSCARRVLHMRSTCLKSVIRSKSLLPNRTIWCSGCPSAWASRSRCPSSPSRAMSWLAAACCRVTLERERSSCSRTSKASASLCTSVRLIQSPRKWRRTKRDFATRARARAPVFTGRIRVLVMHSRARSTVKS